MPCPIHGERNIAEFFCKGPVLSMPNATRGTRQQWARYLFLAENKAGIVDEWWLHSPSSLWFVARRDTTSDEILQTWTIEAYRTQQQKKTTPKATPKATSKTTTR